jgi:hypothetical protein
MNLAAISQTEAFLQTVVQQVLNPGGQGGLQ